MCVSVCVSVCLSVWAHMCPCLKHGPFSEQGALVVGEPPVVSRQISLAFRGTKAKAKADLASPPCWCWMPPPTHPHQGPSAWAPWARLWAALKSQAHRAASQFALGRETVVLLGGGFWFIVFEEASFLSS